MWQVSVSPQGGRTPSQGAALPAWCTHGHFFEYDTDKKARAPAGVREKHLCAEPALLGPASRQHKATAEWGPPSVLGKAQGIRRALLSWLCEKSFVTGSHLREGKYLF